MMVSEIVSLALRYGQYVLLAVAIGWIYHAGHKSADMANQLAIAQAQIQSDAKAKALSDKALGQASSEAQSREQQNQQLTEKVDQYEKALADEAKANQEFQQRHDETVQAYEARLRQRGKAKPHPRDCALSDADVRSLLNIQ